MPKLNVKVITPEKIVYESEQVDSITLPTSDGEITVLPGHIPLFSKVVQGEAIVRIGSRVNSLITTDGFIKVSKNGDAILLTDYAIRSENIEIAKALEAKKKAEEIMRQKQSERDFTMAEADLRRILLELKVAQNKKRGT